MILWIRYAASVLSLALVYEFIVSSSATARRPKSDQGQTRPVLNKQYMEAIPSNIPEKINASFWNHLRDLSNGDWTQGHMKVVQKFEQQFIKISKSAGNKKFPQYLFPSIDNTLRSKRTRQPVLDRMSMLFNFLLRELHRFGSSRHNSVPRSNATDRTFLKDKCERTKRESPSYPRNSTSLEHAQFDTQENISYTDKQNSSGQNDDNERITIAPLTESIQANESTSKPPNEVTTNRKRITVRRSRRRAYRSRVIAPKVKKKVECLTVVACIHPYISYLAGTIMFILVVYLIIVFGKCVCDDSF
ncbi:uncharacterized protein LOC110442678 [Mizuhopecten yessoensis]|uniref:Uncharacterized protein n=1 Tax=Mizuhopecten yessoensis TaxID=6573 RepID=A0A210PGR5_MIZYE|nr:uncharacterized protein LOC110442678 [Mizuhopecten yessoensis]OWF35661.1 hypothetical protein KP79_PYT09734 [Mizuhopecten yessoensis]